MSVYVARFALENRITTVVDRGIPMGEICAGEYPRRIASENQAGIGEFGGLGGRKESRRGDCSLWKFQRVLGAISVNFPLGLMPTSSR